MDIARLREFVTLASQLKLSSAAQELYMSPSTLSHHIVSLEKELGCELFERTNGFTLTERGEVALEHAQKILFEHDAMLRDCTAPPRTDVMRLSIPNYHYLRHPLIEAREPFLAAHPGCKVALRSNECQDDDPFDVLASGESDVSALYIVRGVGYTIDDKVPCDVAYVKLRPQRCVFVSTRSHPLADKPILTASDMNGATVCIRLCPVCTVLMDGIARALSAHGADVRVMYRKATRNADILLNDLGLSYMAWFEQIGTWDEPNLPDLPIHGFEHEIVADTYLLYRPDRLGPLQIAYLQTAQSLCEQ